MNERQELALQRGLQRPFSMVQGPPGTGKTSFLVQCVAALLSASREGKKGRLSAKDSAMHHDATIFQFIFPSIFVKAKHTLLR